MTRRYTVQEIPDLYITLCHLSRDGSTSNIRSPPLLIIHLFGLFIKVYHCSQYFFYFVSLYYLPHTNQPSHSGAPRHSRLTTLDLLPEVGPLLLSLLVRSVPFVVHVSGTPQTQLLIFLPTISTSPHSLPTDLLLQSIHASPDQGIWGGVRTTYPLLFWDLLDFVGEWSTPLQGHSR